MSEEKPVKCSEVIGTCKYSCRLNGCGNRYCGYFSMTGCRRDCDPEACTKYERKSKRENVNASTFNYVLDPLVKPKTENKNVDLNNYKHDAIKVARDLCYGTEILAKINDAKSSFEVDRIMTQARRDK